MTEFRFRPEVVQGGPVLVFRNEEERRQGCRVLATLRESLHDGGPAGSSIPKCGRDCLAQVASRRLMTTAAKNRRRRSLPVSSGNPW